MAEIYDTFFGLALVVVGDYMVYFLSVWLLVWVQKDVRVEVVKEQRTWLRYETFLGLASVVLRD